MVWLADVASLGNVVVVVLELALGQWVAGWWVCGCHWGAVVAVQLLSAGAVLGLAVQVSSSKARHPLLRSVF